MPSRATRPAPVWMRRLWQEAQIAKNAYLHTIQRIEHNYVEANQAWIGQKSIGLLWLGELMIGIEITYPDGTRHVYYEDDLQPKKQEEHNNANNMV